MCACVRVRAHFDISLSNFSGPSRINFNPNPGTGKTTGVEGDGGKKYLNCNYLYIIIHLK